MHKHNQTPKENAGKRMICSAPLEGKTAQRGGRRCSFEGRRHSFCNGGENCGVGDSFSIDRVLSYSVYCFSYIYKASKIRFAEKSSALPSSVWRYHQSSMLGWQNQWLCVFTLAICTPSETGAGKCTLLAKNTALPLYKRLRESCWGFD